MPSLQPLAPLLFVFGGAMENEATDTRTVQFKNSTGKQKKH
ncbi:hypothetical protein NC99_05810 [Sunxiuqinia dokdonensis]|uniref:Uncharacterized protein n=1 Tax=Sunxiuqinia dokdonensis TaxID=1409788 RepID=A0A0L8VDS0_9BACT|nr:hypothetical protein NC99_05810 [Sunxiuqinia dokdonensis]